MYDKFARSELLPLVVQMEAYNRLSKELLDAFLEEIDEEIVEERLFNTLKGTAFHSYYQDWYRDRDQQQTSLS